MLIHNSIPSKQPIINVGIIIPEDNIKNINIILSDSQSYEIVTNENYFPSCKNKSIIKIELKNNKLHLKKLELITSKISLIPIINDDSCNVTIPHVNAGRGFHWQKKITASYWGEITFSILDGRLIAINKLKIEDYLKCVATSEMSGECPPELLKAQSIVARSWLLANKEQKHKALNFDVCNDDCCQRYQGINNINKLSNACIEKTFGQVLIHDNKICDARYSKSCGGKTEKYENVWGGRPIPYLDSIKDVNDSEIEYCNPKILNNISIKKYIGNVDEDSEYFRWTYIVIQKEIIKNLNLKYNILAKKVTNLIPEKIGESGRILELIFIYLDMFDNSQTLSIKSEYKIRDVLSKKFLFSSAFTITRDNSDFILNGKGWGHGVGLCQIGALGMAISNKKNECILKHYYPHSSLKKIYSS